MGRMAGNFIAEEFEYIVSEKNTAGAILLLYMQDTCTHQHVLCMYNNLKSCIRGDTQQY